MNAHPSSVSRPFGRFHRFRPPSRWVAVGVLVALVALTIGAVSVTRVRARGTDPAAVANAATATDIMRAEIDGMLASGIPADHPKVARLEDDLAAMEAGAQTTPPGEPGLDLSGVLGTPSGRGARSLDDTGDEAVAWDSGMVECEPVPPDVLTAGEVAGAQCASAPQPDGSTRYVALAVDGTARVVRFAPHGSVSREPDIRVDLFGALLGAITLTVDVLGNVVVSVSGTPQPIATIDPG